ncbi:DUF4377 domain-containing protein [Winogradskyella bathintestinalis]|uniref:DUF4377 domain-containing protein n=1 Tax=Winogradskyella bathintestinalis TaxID=3035208 RepID=A0ABT7ZU48_9FLAO|nr:DUF4377 domain-containing protein [Winogradskyella bathintestinalis]MDN3492525.1 DUF4377 domain-containing protein [Winogradskyella bathintestinalis]
MFKLKTLFIIMFTVLLTSCGSSKNATTISTYWVNSAKVDCDAGVGKTQCLQVTKAESYVNADWNLFYASINGFTFEPGYLYKIEVSETTLDPNKVPADTSSIQYELIDVLEKIQDPKLAIHDIWSTTHINGKAITDQLIAPSLEINTTEMRVMGNNGCNNYNGSITSLDSISIKFGAIATTRKMCPDMTVSDRFDNALRNSVSYKKDGLNLLLLNNSGEEILRFKKVD